MTEMTFIAIMYHPYRRLNEPVNVNVNTEQKK